VQSGTSSEALEKLWLDALPDANNKSYTVWITEGQESIPFTTEPKLHTNFNN